MRFLFLLLFVTFALLPRSHAADRPPNLVIILADDLGWGDVGFNGRKDWATPQLDELARQGTVFRRWYTAGVVCAPSRAALMTGKYGIHNGVVANNDDLPRDEITLPEALKRHGYVTALMGKWHHGQKRPGESDYVHPMDHGFDQFIGYTSARDAWEHFPKELWFGREKMPVSGYAATMLTDHALAFAKRHKDRPFFLYLAHIVPHLLIEAPPEDVERFRGKFKEKDPTKPYNATYAAMISRLDAEIGRFVKGLDALGLGNDTLIVFTSDHGATFEEGNKGAAAFHDSNGPFRGQKRTLWEGGIRVPAVVRWPGKIPPGKVSNELVHMTDVFPTLLSAAGHKPEPAWKVDGLDLLDVWRGRAKAPERTLYWEWRTEGHNQLAAMRGDLKLVITGNNRPELFNVENDPAERRSLHGEQPDLYRTLQQELRAWLATETEAAKWGKPPPK